MKILFLPNWKVAKLTSDNPDIQAPDKHVTGQPYWFFRDFDTIPEVEVLDIQAHSWLYTIEKKVGIYFTQSWKAFRKRKEYDVVISHGAQSGLFYSLLNRFSRDPRTPRHVIFDIGGMNGARKNWLECSLIRFALASKPAIICHSSCLLDHYREVFPSVADEATFIPFGVDTDDFKPIDCEVIPQVLSFGYAKRDYKTLLEAWKQVSVGDVRLKIIGSGIKEEIPGVDFMKGVPLAELKQEIAKSLFVVIPLPVYNYSYGQMSFLQSMSMGKAVIVTRTPSSVDYLENGRGASIVPPCNAKALADGMKIYLKHPDILTQQSRSALTTVCTCNSEKQMATLIEKKLQVQ